MSGHVGPILLPVPLHRNILPTRLQEWRRRMRSPASTILRPPFYPPSVVVVPVLWHLKSDFQEALWKEPAPSSCPSHQDLRPNLPQGPTHHMGTHVTSYGPFWHHLQTTPTPHPEVIWLAHLESSDMCQLCHWWPTVPSDVPPPKVRVNLIPQVNYMPLRVLGQANVLAGPTSH